MATYSLGHSYTSAAPLSLSDSERRRHLYLSGKTGTGKSTVLFNLMLSDIHEGRGFALLDPHGDLAQQIADAIPAHRINDVIYLDPQDPTHAVGFNPLEQVPKPQRSLVTSSIVSGFKSIWHESWGPRMEYILGHTVRLLLDIPGATLLHIPLVLAQDTYRRRLLKCSTDPLTSYFWTSEFARYPERQKAEAISPIQNKAGQFAANPSLRAILAQKSTPNIDTIMNGRKILIANLSKQMGTEPSHLLGAFLATAFSQAAERRSLMPETDRRDFSLYVDEFQNFATESFATILSEARKWRLNLVLANQFLGQLPASLRQAILGNVGTLVAFRVGSEDAVPLAAELGLKVPLILTDTPNFEAWIKLVRNNIPSEPILLKTAVESHPVVGSLAAIINRTHARYARRKQEVETSVENLFASGGQRRPAS